MMDFTEEQLSAINNRNRTLLVSAAAGSGKTATLTERIIRSLLDEKNPIDISEMLIVTFTRAAARELQEKITKAIKNSLSNDRENQRLKRQLNLLPGAKISTIDSFCADILRGNAEKFGITPSYRIAEGAEANILSLTILNALIEETYSGERTEICSPIEFEELCSCLVGVKSDQGLAECFLSLHDSSKSSIKGAKIFGELAKLHYLDDGDALESNIYIRYSIDCVKEFSNHFIHLFEIAKSRLAGETKSELGCIAGIENDVKFIKAGADLNSYAEAREFLKSPFPKKPSVAKTEISEGTEFYAAVRELYKKYAAKFYERLFSFNESEWRESAKKSNTLINILAKFIETFDEIYFEHKRRMGILEYSDVEKMAFEILYDGENFSDTALAMREQFKAIYIDEYQDVSPIQNAIFDAISKEDNRFMVGDVKQSIYGFRSARPEIFVNMKKKFPIIKDGIFSKANSVFLSKNFRSDAEIINFVNEIFDKMFDITKDSIGYVSEDRLTHGKAPVESPKKPRVHLFLNDSGENAESEDFEEFDEENELDTTQTIPNFVAKMIKEFVKDKKLNNGENPHYSDIAILFRHNDTIKKYKEAFDRFGIPTEAIGNKDFFLNPDILLMLCILNSIDNPRRDVYLAGLMCSPLFSFTADELYKIANYNKKACLYNSLIEYCEANPNRKCEYFISELKRYRALAEGIGVDALISKLYNETGVLYLASKNGSKNNLMLLYNYAQNYEKNGYKGLYSFISYVNRIIENKETFETVAESGEGDAVKISSIHSSKGLEYPIVFLVEAQRIGGNVEQKARVSFKEDFGIGFKLRDKSGIALVGNPIKNAISMYQQERLFEEELRVLYVALTRAKEELYVLGKSRIKAEKFLLKTDLSRAYLSSFSKNMLPSFLDVILASVDNEKIERHTITEDFSKDIHSPVSNFEEQDGQSEISCKEISERFKFVYPFVFHTKLPEKLSISHLYPSILDDGDEDDIPSIDKAKKKAFPSEILPSFAGGNPSEESAKAGIATHTFMQFCVFENLERSGSNAELERLVKSCFISKSNAERVRLSEIDKFTHSKLFKEMRGAKKVYRELRFNLRLPASSFTNEQDKKQALANDSILLQGVIDCIIESSDGSLHLVDYKTDRLSKAELENPALAGEKLKAAHGLQLEYYRQAVKEMFGKEPSATSIYSLPLGDTVDL